MSATGTAASNPDESPDESLQRRKAQWLALGAGPHFGAVIALLRDLKGETRAGLVKASGRSYSQIRGLELGDRWPSDKMLTSIAGPLQCTPGNLIETRDDLLLRLDQATSDTRQEVTLDAWLNELPKRFGGEIAIEPLLPGAQGMQFRPDKLWDLGDGRKAVIEVKTGPGKTTKILAAAQQRPTTEEGGPVWERKVLMKLANQMDIWAAAEAREAESPGIPDEQKWLVFPHGRPALNEAPELADELRTMSMSLHEQLDAQMAAVVEVQRSLQLELESALKRWERVTPPDLATQIQELTAEERALVGAYVRGLLDARSTQDTQSTAEGSLS